MVVHRSQHSVLVVAPFSVTAIHHPAQTLFLQAVHPNDWSNVPGLVSEMVMMVETNSREELTENEEWVVLVYPVFVPFLFELNLPAFQLKPIPIVLLSFQLSRLFSVLVP
jgi:hypothetical protein